MIGLTRSVSSWYNQAGFEYTSDACYLVLGKALTTNNAGSFPPCTYSNFRMCNLTRVIYASIKIQWMVAMLPIMHAIHQSMLIYEKMFENNNYIVISLVLCYEIHLINNADRTLNIGVLLSFQRYHDICRVQVEFENVIIILTQSIVGLSLMFKFITSVNLHSTNCCHTRQIGPNQWKYVRYLSRVNMILTTAAITFTMQKRFCIIRIL